MVFEREGEVDRGGWILERLVRGFGASNCILYIYIDTRRPIGKEFCSIGRF